MVKKKPEQAQPWHEVVKGIAADISYKTPEPLLPPAARKKWAAAIKKHAAKKDVSIQCLAFAIELRRMKQIRLSYQVALLGFIGVSAATAKKTLLAGNVPATEVKKLITDGGPTSTQGAMASPKSKKPKPRR